MIKEALYRMAAKADKEAREGEKYYCPFCFVSLIKKERPPFTGASIQRFVA